MNLDDFEAFVARALFLDQPDPVRSWGELRAFQAGADRAAEAARASCASRRPGTDVTLSVKGRTWVNSDGKRNMPSGEVFTGPLETSANGRIRFGVPSSPAGVDVAGVELEFRDGVVVAARAPSAARTTCSARWPPTTARAASARSGSARTSASTAPIGATLFDEKIGGTVHLALGRSYPETGGKNESALHWDLICDLRERRAADAPTARRRAGRALCAVNGRAGG